MTDTHTTSEVSQSTSEVSQSLIIPRRTKVPVKKICLPISHYVAKKLTNSTSHPLRETSPISVDNLDTFSYKNWKISPLLPETDANTTFVIDFELSDIQELFNLLPAHRGRWIYNCAAGDKNSTGFYDSWNKLSEIIQCGSLFNCNACCKSKGVVWLYCDFSLALQVHDKVKFILNILSPSEFYIPTKGVVITR